jgi:hypothetical protein
MLREKIKQKEDGMSSACSTRGKGEKLVQHFCPKLKGKRLLGRVRRGWDDNININTYLKAIWTRCI